MTLADGDDEATAPPARPRRRTGEATRPSASDRSAAARKRGAESGLLPELLRRGLTLGFTGFFMTEEALRRALGDSMPRDWLEFMVEQSERTRAELLDRLQREFGRVLQAVDPVEMVKRVLDGQTIEVTARIRLVKERGGEAKPGGRGEADR